MKYHLGIECDSYDINILIQNVKFYKYLPNSTRIVLKETILSIFGSKIYCVCSYNNNIKKIHEISNKDHLAILVEEFEMSNFTIFIKFYAYGYIIALKETSVLIFGLKIYCEF